jgi:hypothetical protein
MKGQGSLPSENALFSLRERKSLIMIGCIYVAPVGFGSALEFFLKI